MDVSGKHVAILVHNYFEQAEFEEPLTTLKNAGAEVTVISADKKDLQGLNHVDKGDTFTADLLLDQATPEDYDALVLPGGAINADNLRMVPAAREWVTNFLDAERPLAVICHAPWVLVSADVVEGRRLTSFYTIQDDIANAGGEWVDLPVVVDGSLITSRKPDDLVQFTDAILKALSGHPESVVDGGPDTIAAQDESGNESKERLKAMGYDEERDQLSEADKRDILTEEDNSDPDQSHLSDVEPTK
jgi:protease I